MNHLKNDATAKSEQTPVLKLAARCGAASYQECLTALENNCFDVRRAERELDENRLDRICRQSSGSSGETFAQLMMNKPLCQITDVGLQFLLLAAVRPN